MILKIYKISGVILDHLIFIIFIINYNYTVNGLHWPVRVTVNKNITNKNIFFTVELVNIILLSRLS